MKLSYNEPMDMGMGTDMEWCPSHRCYHRPSEEPLTLRVIIEAIYRRYKLTVRQAKRYVLVVNGDTVGIPQREHGEWVQVRYRWWMDGTNIRLGPPDDWAKPSLS